jgi:adenylate kinase family enzyme
MRVYIAGAHSVGKSTLSRYISESYKLPMVTEVARQVLSERELAINSLRTNLDIVDSYQTEVFERQMSEEEKYTSFVSDRTFDNLAYAVQHSRIFAKLIKLSKFDKYLESLKNSEAFVFFVRPSKETLREDGVRETLNWDGIVAIDAMIKLMIEMWEIPYIQINTSNMQERVRLIDNVLGRYQK